MTQFVHRILVIATIMLLHNNKGVSLIQKQRNLTLTWRAWTRIKILSTPTAKTRKGRTSMMIRVKSKPNRVIIPMEEKTLASTITTPVSPRKILDSTKSFEDDEIFPRESETYANITR